MTNLMRTFEALGENDQSIARTMSDAARCVLQAFGRKVCNDDHAARFDEACAVYLQAGYGPGLRSEDPAAYEVRWMPLSASPQGERDAEDQLTVARALAILERKVYGETLTSPAAATTLLRLQMGALEHEEFAVLFLTSQHQVISLDRMFRGSLTQTSVYPREVVKAALRHNAGAVILCHNHPSGGTEPSRADEHLTGTIKGRLPWWTCACSTT